MKKPKTTLGRVEIISFPELGIENLTAKIDTGAYSTAIHAHKFGVEIIDGKEILHFQLLDPDSDESSEKVFRTKNFSRKKVRSSNGRREERFIVKTTIILGGKTRVTDLSLTNREKMKYPVLIGRKVLANGFIVDVSKKKIKQPKHLK